MQIPLSLPSYGSNELNLEQTNKVILVVVG